MADAGRVIAGTAKGTRLLAPGEGTRPISDRVKQTLFAILEPDLPGARVLDLFAGSGAGGIEALSRGAAHADFVEHDAGAARVIGQNLVRAHADENARIHRQEAAVFLRTIATEPPPGHQPYDVVIVDPPYADTTAMKTTLEALVAHADVLLAPGAWVVAKHFWRTPPPQIVGLLASVRGKRFGETALTFYRRSDYRRSDRAPGAEPPEPGSDRDGEETERA
jgi:16S rRNA (guanine966-N2)-methyltransferase